MRDELLVIEFAHAQFGHNAGDSLTSMCNLCRAVEGRDSMVDLKLGIVLLHLSQAVAEVLGGHFGIFLCLHDGLHILGWVIVATNDELGCDWELLCCKAESFLGDIEGYTLDFDDHTSGGDWSYITFGITFTRSEERRVGKECRL